MKKTISKYIDSPSSIADILGVEYTSRVTKEHKKGQGQFFTPTEIASFMGNLAVRPTTKHIKILDPGCGTCILTCSLIENLIQYEIESVEVTAYETDLELTPFTNQSLNYLKAWLKERSIKMDFKLITDDFIEDVASGSDTAVKYDYIISNPPYFKLSKDDSRVKLFQDLVKGQSNIYSFFMAVSVNLLKESGEMIFIVPRSFASGQYFNSFRNYFFENISLEFVHLFKSRSDTFDRDSVLQELLILKGRKEKLTELTISTSEGVKDLNAPQTKRYHINEIIDLDSKAKILHLPTTEYEEKVMDLFKSWGSYLADYGIQISTGPVVSFRARTFLHETYSNGSIFLGPLFWLHNVKKMNVEWPLPIQNKSQYISIEEKSRRILIPNKNYVLLRRFSSKDDKSRLIAAPFISNGNEFEQIGVENKLNYIYRIKGELEEKEVIGIAALLNSKIFDTYFRTFNGNVNVSATEIRLMPFPSLDTIHEIGEVLEANKVIDQNQVDEIVNRFLLTSTESNVQN